MTNRLTTFLWVPAIILAAIAPEAYAAALTAEGSVNVGFCHVDSNTLLDPTPPGLRLGFPTVELSHDVTTNNAFIHVYGDNATSEFGSASYGHNTYFAGGRFTLTDTITSPSIYTFTIQPGEVMVSGSLSTAGGEEVEARLHISLTVDGVSEFDTSRDILLTNAPMICGPVPTCFEVGGGEWSRYWLQAGP